MTNDQLSLLITPHNNGSVHDRASRASQSSGQRRRRAKGERAREWKEIPSFNCVCFTFWISHGTRHSIASPPWAYNSNNNRTLAAPNEVEVIRHLRLVCKKWSICSREPVSVCLIVLRPWFELELSRDMANNDTRASRRGDIIWLCDYLCYFYLFAMDIHFTRFHES